LIRRFAEGGLSRRWIALGLLCSLWSQWPGAAAGAGPGAAKGGSRLPAESTSRPPDAQPGLSATAREEQRPGEGRRGDAATPEPTRARPAQPDQSQSEKPFRARPARSTPDFSLRYVYDAAGRLTEVWRAVPGGFESCLARYAYHPDGLLQRIDYANGVATEFFYPPNGWVERIETKNADNQLVHYYAYGYDRDGNRLLQWETNITPARRAADPGWARTSDTTRYGYDRLGRLVEVSYHYNTPAERRVAYGYDAVGNRTAERETDAAGLPLRDRTYTYDRRHRLLHIADLLQPEASQAYEYNAAGDLLARTEGPLGADGQVHPEDARIRLEFLWDAWGRLRQVTRLAPPGGSRPPDAQPSSALTGDPFHAGPAWSTRGSRPPDAQPGVAEASGVAAASGFGGRIQTGHD